MAYSKSLVERIRHLISRQRGITEKKMFGCVCFLLNGNLLVGVWKDSLIARVGKDAYDAAVRTAQAEYDQHQPDVIVGSSRGGAVALQLQRHSTGPAVSGMEEVGNSQQAQAKCPDPAQPQR